MDKYNGWSRIRNKNKPYDFLKGLGLGFSILFVGFFFVSLLMAIFIYLGAIIAFLCVGKWKFALGLISAILIPVAIVGGCMLVLGELKI